MTLEYLINTYGYLAILLGTFIEGETVLIMGALAAQLGYLHLPWVIVAAFAGALCWDQLLFFIGRRYGASVLARFPKWRPRAEKVFRLIERHRTPIILVFPFLHGFREVSPIAIGMSRVPAALFILLNASAAVVWSVALGLGGYFFGHGLQLILGDVRRYQLGGLIVIVCIGAAVWLIKHFTSRQRNPAENRPAQGEGR